MMPPVWLNNWLTVARATSGCSPDTYAPARSSSRSRPFSTSLRMPAAVKVLECEATRKRCSGVNASPVLMLATPMACASTTLPPCATAKEAPGSPIWAIW